MNRLAPLDAARAAISNRPGRPAMALLHDTPERRVIVFRIGPGEEVPPHRSGSAVLLTVLAGAGTISGDPSDTPASHECVAGDVIAYAPNELHGMKAGPSELLVMASITPRPGSN